MDYRKFLKKSLEVFRKDTLSKVDVLNLKVPEIIKNSEMQN